MLAVLSARFTVRCPGSDDEDEDERVLRAVIFFTAGDSASLSKRNILYQCRDI